MRALQPALLGLLLALAGCSADPPRPGPDDDAAAAPVDPALAPQDANATAAATDLPRLEAVYRFGSNLTFANTLRRFAVTATENVSFDLDIGLTPMTVDRPANCLAFAAAVLDANATLLASNWVIAWAGDAGIATEASVAGQRVTVVPEPFPDQSPGLSGLQLTGGMTGNLTAGERLVLQVGGARAPADEQRIDLVVEGDVVVEALPDAPLACGRGVRDAQGGTGVATYIVTASVGGEIAYATQRASTLVADLGASVADSSVEAVFLDDTPRKLTGALALSREQAGAMALRIASHVDSAGSLSWFFADTLWPVVEDDA